MNEREGADFSELPRGVQDAVSHAIDGDDEDVEYRPLLPMKQPFGQKVPRGLVRLAILAVVILIGMGIIMWRMK